MKDEDKRADEIKALCREHAEDMVQVLADIANDTAAKDAPRVAAAKTLLERGFGAPERKVEKEVNHHLYDHRTAHMQALQRISKGRPQIGPPIEDAEFTEATNSPKEGKPK